MDRRWRALRILVSVIAIVVGLGIVLVTIAVGHCSAFGGRCPSSTSWDWEVFGSAAGGGAIAAGIPTFLAAPSLRRIGLALAAAAAAGALVGLLAIAITG